MWCTLVIIPLLTLMVETKDPLFHTEAIPRLQFGIVFKRRPGILLADTNMYRIILIISRFNISTISEV